MIKKIGIIGIIGILGIAAFLFLKSSDMVKGSDFNIGSAMTINDANAEDGYGIVCKCMLTGICRANGNQEVCASFEGNGFCSVYDSNCGAI